MAIAQSILVTGANGFIGKILCQTLVQAGFKVKAAVRDKTAAAHLPHNVVTVIVGSVDANTEWRNALAGVQVVVHLAARVHIMQDSAPDPLDAFRRVNTQGTRRLVQQAQAAQVKRLIFISTIKVLGEYTAQQTFHALSPPAPQDPYAQTKWEAEQAIQHLCAHSTLSYVILRVPLVYGAGVKGNFLRLMQWVQRGIPLPLALLNNQRSYLYVENLCDLIRVCLTHPQAHNQTLLCADQPALSTPNLIRLLAKELTISCYLWPVPLALLKIIAALSHKHAELERLCNSLLIDSSTTQQLLGWQPLYSTREGLARTVAAYRKTAQ